MKRAALALAALLTGCALTSKATPPALRYFSPETEGARASASIAAPDRPRLRLGRVTSSPYLRARIVYRESTFELGSYEDRRWTEDPDAYLRRALARELFTERLTEVVGGPGPSLDVEVVAFEELRRSAARFGRVELAYVLHDEHDVLASGSCNGEARASSTSMTDIVAAIAAAEDAATLQLVLRVAARLGAPR